MMTVAQLIEFVEPRGACDYALRWLRSLPADMPAEEAYQICHDAYWMLWLAEKVDVEDAGRTFAMRAARALLPHLRGEVAIAAEKLVRLAAECQEERTEERRAAIKAELDAQRRLRWRLSPPDWFAYSAARIACRAVAYNDPYGHHAIQNAYMDRGIGIPDPAEMLRECVPWGAIEDRINRQWVGEFRIEQVVI